MLPFIFKLIAILKNKKVSFLFPLATFQGLRRASLTSSWCIGYCRYRAFPMSREVLWGNTILWCLNTSSKNSANLAEKQAATGCSWVDVFGPRPRKSRFSESRAGPRNEYILKKLPRWSFHITRSYNWWLVSKWACLRKLHVPQGCSRELLIPLLVYRKALLLQSYSNWWPTCT